METTTIEQRPTATERPPSGLGALIERFDPEVMDLPGGTARIRLIVDGDGEWDALIEAGEIRIEPASSAQPDALISAGAATWSQVAADVRGGMTAFRAGRMRIRQNLHLGVGFLAATSGITDERRLRFVSVQTRVGTISTLAAGEGDPVICIHGLGATKASFLPTVAALADSHRVIAMDLPGFGESDKPISAPYDAPYFARAVTALLDSAGDRARAPGRQQHGRPRLDRDGPARAGADREDRPAEPGARLAAGPPLALAPLRAPAEAGPDPAGPAGDHRADRPQPRAGGERRLVGGRRGRVPALLPHPPRARRLLRGRPQHLPRRTAWRERPLVAAGGHAARLPVRLGAPRSARPDRVSQARRAGAAGGAPPGAGLRARSPDGSAPADARGHPRVSSPKTAEGHRRAAVARSPQPAALKRPSASSAASYPWRISRGQ